MEYKDLMEAKAMLGGNGLSQYEQIKVGNMTKKASGTAIGALCVGVGAVVGVVGVAAWATAKASEARRVAKSDNDATAALLRMAVEQSRIEHQERVSGDITLNQTITDTISGQQTSSQNQSVTQEVTQQVMAGLMTGSYEKRPERVTIWRDAQQCDCPGGCVCGGR